MVCTGRVGPEQRQRGPRRVFHVERLGGDDHQIARPMPSVVVLP